MGCKLEFSINLLLDDKDAIGKINESEHRRINDIDGILPSNKNGKIEFSNIESETGNKLKLYFDTSAVSSENGVNLEDEFKEGNIDNIIKIIANSTLLEKLIRSSGETSVSKLFSDNIAYNNIDLADELNNNNLYVLPNTTINDLKYVYGQHINNPSSITESLIVVNDNKKDKTYIGNNEIEGITKVKVGDKDFLFIPKSYLRNKKFESYINIRDTINNIKDTKEIDSLLREHTKNEKEKGIKEYFDKIIKSKAGITDDFISFCKANLEGNRYGNDADNMLYNTLVDVSSSLKNKRKNGFTSYEDFSKSINRINNDNLINYIKRVMESDSITDVQKNSLSSLITEETKDGSKKHVINITKDNFVVFMTILSNKLDISSGLFQLISKTETGFSLKYNPFGLILDKIKGLNIYNYNAYDIKNIERVGDQNVYSVKTSLKKGSKTIYFVSPNESSFNLESSKNLYNTKQDAINAANRASIKISEILPFTDIHDKGNNLDENKIIVMSEDPIYTLKKGSVRSVRIKPEVSTDRTIGTVRILNNLKTDFSDVNIGTKITTSSAVADRISTFVSEYIYRERAKTEEEENEVNQFIENLNEAFNGSYDA